MAREVFTTLGTVKERLELIQNDPNVVNPALLFNRFLDLTVSLNDKIIPNAIIDILNQINVFNVFDELIETKTEDIKNHGGLMYQCIKYLKLHLDLDASNFEFLRKANTDVDPYRKYSKLVDYEYTSKEF